MRKNNIILEQIAQQSTVETIDVSNSCLLRGCFDSASSEWGRSALDEKVEALKKLINKDGENTLKLSVGMMDYCNREAGKGIKPMDLILSMSKIIDHLLKEAKS